MLKPRFLLCALVVTAGLLFAGGRTLWQDGGVQLCGPTASTPMAATSDSAGGVIAVWEDARISPGSIYAQRVNGSGVPLWTDGGVFVDGSVGPGGIRVVDDGEGGAIVVWGPSSAGASIAIQRLGADGAPLWGANGLELRPLVGSPPLDNLFAVVSDGHYGAIVAWTAHVIISGPLDTIIACRVDSSGTKRWEAVVRTDTMDDPPSLCEDGLGGIIIAWSSVGGGAVRVQYVDSAGSVKWDPAGVLACTLSRPQGERACVPVGESCFAVGWFCGGDSAFQHRAQMFDLAGNRLWDLAGAALSGGFNSTSSAVGLSGNGHRQLLWLWSENTAGTCDFFAQKLDLSGTRRWDSAGVRLGGTDTSWIRGFSATTDVRGGAIATWALYRSQLNWDVYAQHVDSAGNLRWTDTGLAVCAGDNNVRYPVAVTDGEGGAIIAWADDRGLYAQRVADGPPAVEAPNAEVRAANAGPTVVRGVLVLNGPGTRSELPERNSVMSRAALLDVSGRGVLDLHPGANDVRRLAPGVYFVRQASGVKHEASSVTKIVLTE